MISNRRLGAIALAVVVLAAGCSGSATPAPTDDGSGNGGGPTPAATVDQGNGLGDTPAPTSDSGTSPEDVMKVGEALVPPNSTEVIRTTTEGYWYVGYESTDSPDSLKGFYESKIRDIGMQIISTTSASGSHSWVIARDESGSFGGSITVAPSGTGSGSTVVIGIGSE